MHRQNNAHQQYVAAPLQHQREHEERKGTLEPNVALRAAADPNTISIAVVREPRWRPLFCKGNTPFRASAEVLVPESSRAAALIALRNLQSQDPPHYLLKHM